MTDYQALAVNNLRQTMRGVTIASVEALLEGALHDLHIDDRDPPDIEGIQTGLEAALELLAQIDAKSDG